MINVLILGANGQVARNTTRVFLRDTDAELTLYLRRARRLSNPGPDRVTIVEGDVLDRPTLGSETDRRPLPEAGRAHRQGPLRRRVGAAPTLTAYAARNSRRATKRNVKLILFGATGMVGAGALREALADPGVDAVLSVGRRPCGVDHPKLRELLLPDLFDLTAAEPQLVGWDAGVWAVGGSSLGLDEAAYAKVTEELTLLWARALLRLNPGFSFCYCSAAGAGGGSMWARVRRRVEGALEATPFRHACCVRPGFIQPGPGIRSHVKVYQAFIVLFKPILPPLVRAFPSLFTTSERLGRAMLRSFRGAPTDSSSSPPTSTASESGRDSSRDSERLPQCPIPGRPGVRSGTGGGGQGSARPGTKPCHAARCERAAEPGAIPALRRAEELS